MKIKSEIVFAVPTWPATVAGGKNAVVAYSKLFLIGQAMQLLRTVLLNNRLTELVLQRANSAALAARMEGTRPSQDGGM